MPLFEQPNATQFYETYGDQGPWLTLVNGHTRSSKDFKAMAKYLVEQGARVLTMDNRGSGETTTEGSFTLADMAEDIVRLWDHLGIKKSGLLGISMGGLISQYLAARFPDRVERLVLISTTSHQEAIQGLEEQPWGQSLTSIKSKLATYFSNSFREKNKLLVEAMAKQILKQIEAGSFLANALAQRTAIKGFDATPLLPQIKAKSLVIHGREDQVIASDGAIALAGQLADARLELINGVGHLLLAEYPKPLYKMVAEFFLNRGIAG